MQRRAYLSSFRYLYSRSWHSSGVAFCCAAELLTPLSKARAYAIACAFVHPEIAIKNEGNREKDIACDAAL